MTGPGLDPERIAALIDGRLPPDERERVLAQIDASPELREAWADALSALGVNTPMPVRAVSRKQLLPALRAPQWIGLAAAAVFVVVVTPVVIRQVSARNLPDIGNTVAHLGVRDDSISAFLPPVWSTTRGSVTDGRAARARAVRLGAELVTLELRVQQAWPWSDQALGIAALLETWPGGGIAATAFRDMAGGSGTPAMVVRQDAAHLAEQVAGTQAVRLGAWLQSARIAAATKDSTFFDATSLRAARRSAAQVGRGDSTRVAADAVAASLAQEPRDWAAVQRAIEALLGLLVDR